MADTIIPIAAGKAAAVSTYLARGGDRVSKGGSKRPGYRYNQGPMKGKTIEQATQDANRLWDGASSAVKEKYARRAGSGALAPSEVAAGYSGPTSQPSPTAAQPRPRPAKATTVGTSTDGSSPEPKVGQSSGFFDKDAADRDEQYRTADNGDGALAAAVAKEAARKEAEARGKPIAAAYEPKNGDAVSVKDKALGEKAPIVNVKDASPSAPREAQPMAESDFPPSTNVTSEGKPVSALAAGELQRRRAAVVATPDGHRVIGDVDASKASGAIGSRVSPTTGLPSGYMPGDALPTGADQAMKDRAAASVTRQTVNESKAAMQPKPFYSPQPKAAVPPPIRPDGGLASSPMSPNEKMMAARPGFEQENRNLAAKQKAYADKESERVTMGDLEKASQGRPISEGMKMGVRPDANAVETNGIQLTKASLSNPSNFPRRTATPEEVEKLKNQPGRPIASTTRR